MVKYINKILHFTMIFLLIFPIKISILGSVACNIIYSIVPIIFLVCKRKSTSAFFKQLMHIKEIRICLFLFLLYFSYSIFITTYNVFFASLTDFTYYKEFFINSIILISRYITCFWVIKDILDDDYNYDYDYVYRWICYVPVVYVLFSIIFLFNPDFKQLWNDIIIIDDRNFFMVEEVEMYITRYGLQGFSGFSHTFICTFTIFLWSKIAYKNTYDYFVLMIILLGNLIYGRVGFICSSVILLIVFFKGISISKSYFRKSVAILLISMLSYSAINYYIEMDNRLKYWSDWLNAPVEAFIDGFSEGRLDLGSSGNTMLNMYYLPDDDYTIIFGDAKYHNSDNSYYGHTDIGYMRTLLFSGIIGSIMVYGISIMMLLGIYRITGSIIDVIVLGVILILFEGKGSVIVNWYVCSMFYIMCNLMPIWKHKLSCDNIKQKE